MLARRAIPIFALLAVLAVPLPLARAADSTTDLLALVPSDAIAVVAAIDRGPTPCGACRQLLAEYAPDAKVWIADARRSRQVREFTVTGLLPEHFLLFRKTTGE